MSHAVRWKTLSGFLSVPSASHQYMDLPLGSENGQANLTERDMPAVGTDSSNVKRKVAAQWFDNDSSGISVLYPKEECLDMGVNCVGITEVNVMEDREMRANYGGTREVKVNQDENKLHAYVEVDLDMSMDQTYSRRSENTTFLEQLSTMGSHSCGPVAVKNIHMGSTFRKGVDNAISTTHSYNKGGFNAVSLGSYQDVMDFLSMPVSSYSLLYEQSSVQMSKMHNEKDMEEPNGKAMMIKSKAVKSELESTNKNKLVKKAACKERPHGFPVNVKKGVDEPNASSIIIKSEPVKSKLESTNKNKLVKNVSSKVSPHSFLTNVRSLTETGMLDEVLVRYVSASGELCGIISGSGYLCGCQSCNFSKALNAYKFELHAGCKTNHPNNHILFENGKSIYQIVQELKATPQSMLFDAIQILTGSPINQKAFSAWQESFQAITKAKFMRATSGNEK